jgi:hypothetical protein
MPLSELTVTLVTPAPLPLKLPFMVTPLFGDVPATARPQLQAILE